MTQATPNPKQILLDLAKELDGDPLEHSCTVHGRKWTMRLLNEEESNWRNSFVNMGSTLSTASSWRLPTLSMGIRAINDVPVYLFFQDEWNSTAASREALAIIEGKGRFSQKYFAAEHLMEYLSQRDPDVIKPLWKEWEILEARREEAQGNIKKSSGENSGEGTKDNGTEFSPSGDGSSAASK
jgi:hypothetical protein